MTEGQAIAELEKLLDALSDDEARKRVLEWARSKYETTPPSKPVGPGLLTDRECQEIQRLLDEKRKEMQERPSKGLRDRVRAA